MKSLALIIVLFLVASLLTTEVKTIKLNYTISGCNETINQRLSPLNPSIIIENQTINYERGINHNCCKEMELNYEINKTIITLNETWMGDDCRCNCYSIIKAQIINMPEGDYTIKAYNNTELLIEQNITLN